MIEHNGIHWGVYHKMLTPQEPPHIEPGIDTSIAKLLLTKSHAWLIRWTSDFDCKNTTEWWWVIKDGPVNLNELNRNARHQIRSGLQNCYAKKVEAEFIATAGYLVYKNAFNRYQTNLKPVSESRFYDGKIKAGQLKLREYWGVFDRATNRLIGYSANFNQDNCCEYVEIKYDPIFLKKYSSNVLIFEMNAYYLNESDVMYVTNGQRTISHETQVNEFLIHKLNFRKAYCRLNIIYNPIIKIFVDLVFPVRLLLLPFLGRQISAVLKQEEIRRSFG